MIWKDFSWKQDTVLYWWKKKYFGQKKFQEWLDKGKSQGNGRKLTFNVTYYPLFKHLKPQLKELLAILVCDEDHKKVFPGVPIIGWKNSNIKYSHLVRAALPDITEVGRYKPCGGKGPPCQL